MHGAFADFADHLDHVVGFDLRREPPRAIDIGMRHGPARIGLEGQRLGHPARAEIADQRVVVALGGVGEAVEETVHAFEHRARSEKAGAAEQRRTDARLRRPAGMQPFGPGAFGEIFDDAARHRADGAERVDHLARVELQRGADTGGGAHGAEHRGRMKSGLMRERRRHRHSRHMVSTPFVAAWTLSCNRPCGRRRRRRGSRGSGWARRPRTGRSSDAWA